MYWQEVPYRAHSVLRSVLQRRGFLSASKVPLPDAAPRYGASWCRVPAPKEPATAALLAQARRLLDGELDVFGQRVPMRNGIPDWNRDPVTGFEIPLDFGLFIDFRHVGHGVDIKHLWEVNRHVWWVPLAQAWAVSGDFAFLRRIGELLDDWLVRCPYPQGANWASPVEHGIRLINWSLVWHLIGGQRSPLFEGNDGQARLRRWLDAIYQHIHFAADNYSFYSSADNHLTGEAAGVFVAAHTWDLWPQVRAARERAKQILEAEALKQIAPDGVNLEQALCYHKFTLQFLLASGLCARAAGDDLAPACWERMHAAVKFLASVTDSRGNVPAIGDADDAEAWCLAHGADFDSYRSMIAIGAAVFKDPLLQAKWQSVSPLPDEQIGWLGLDAPPAADRDRLIDLPRSFPTGGYQLMGADLHRPEEMRVMVDVGPLGYNRICGHGHADALSVLLSAGGEPLLVDPGTYCYNAAPHLRHYFRGTHAHNTLVVDDTDQSLYGASFLWLRDIATRVVERRDGGTPAVHAWHDGYMRLSDPVRHHRRVSVTDSRGVLVEDWIECAQPHDVQLLWHAAPHSSITADGTAWRLQAQQHAVRIDLDAAAADVEVVSGREAPPQGWVSRGFYDRIEAPVLVCRLRLEPGRKIRTRLTVTTRPTTAA